MPTRLNRFLLSCLAILIHVSLIHGEDSPKYSLGSEPEYPPGSEELKIELELQRHENNPYVESQLFHTNERALLNAIMGGKVEDIKKLRPVLDKKWSASMSDAAINSPSPDVPEYLWKEGFLKIPDLWMCIIRGDEKGTAEVIRKLPKMPKYDPHRPFAVPVIDGVPILFDELNAASISFATNNPLRLAVRRGHTGIIKQLIEAGADVNHQAFFIGHPRPTPICEAIVLGHTEIVKLLVDAGANLEVADIDHGDSVMPLSLAIHSGRANVVSVLLEGGVKPAPYLYSAILKGNPDIVRTLVKHGANVNALNAQGKTLLWVATANQQGDIADILREAGAKMEADPINPPPDQTTEIKSKDQ